MQNIDRRPQGRILLPGAYRLAHDTLLVVYASFEICHKYSEATDP